MSYFEDSAFVTLTYDDDHLPSPASLDKRELQLFFKRLRKAYDKPIKYFASGEYGDKNARPHYHAILLGFADPNSYVCPKSNIRRSPFIERVWQSKGMCHYGTVTYDSCRYVCDYTFKKYTEKYNKKIYGDLLPPFQLTSQGMGLRYAEANSAQISDNLGITMFGENVGLPLYYKRKLNIDKDKLAESARAHKDELKEHYSVADSDDDEYYIKRWRESLEQAKLNIMAREALKGSKLL